MTRMSRRAAAIGCLAAPIAATLPGAAFAATHQVAIEGFKFSPANLSIKAGDTVVFTNNDGAPHTASADDGSWTTARLGRGQSESVVISKAGNHSYFCKVHPNMKAVIRAS